MIEFTNPLTEDTLRNLMRDERYWNTSHPQHQSYALRIKEGFDELYGAEPVKYDATGRMIAE